MTWVCGDKDLVYKRMLQEKRSLHHKYAAYHKWTRLWLETGSIDAVNAFKNPSIIPLRLRNRWHNCTHKV